MANFVNGKGETKYFNKDEVGMKRSITIDGVTWKRMPKPKVLSRAARLGEQTNLYYQIVEKYESVIGAIEEMDLTVETFTPEQLEQVKSLLEGLDTDIDVGEIECLKDEIENWKSGMEGTNLENSNKYSELEECFGYLESAVSELESLSFDSEINEETDPEELKDRLQEFVDTLQASIDELENVQFPGMY